MSLINIRLRNFRLLKYINVQTLSFQSLKTFKIKEDILVPLDELPDSEQVNVLCIDFLVCILLRRNTFLFNVNLKILFIYFFSIFQHI